MVFLVGGGLGVLAITLGLSLAASIFFRKKPKTHISDQEPATTASRGDYIGRLIGRRKIGAVIGYVGNRQTTKEDSGKKIKGGSTVKVFWEEAVHWLCVGPTKAIYNIYMDGKLISDTTITPGTHPSGTKIEITGASGVEDAEGSFYIYWGELAQPINTLLSDSANNPGFGIASRWPYICYIHWKWKKLGLVTRWPNIEYDIEADPFNTGTWLSSNPLIADTGTSSRPDNGVNPAHIIADLLFNEFPHGIGRDPAHYDLTSLDAIAATLNTEGMSASVFVKNGDTVKQVLAALMQDYGIFIALNNSGLQEFRLIREPSSSIPIIPDEAIISPLPEIDKNLGAETVDTLVFSFKDRERRFRDSTIVEGQDGVVKLTRARRGRTITIETTVSFDTAAKIADRRSQEEIGGDIKIDVDGNHDCRNLIPGDALFLAGIEPSLRLISKKPQPTSAKTQLEFLIDFYGVLSTDFTNPGAPSQIPDLNPDEPGDFILIEDMGFGSPGGGTPGPGPGPGGGNPPTPGPVPIPGPRPAGGGTDLIIIGDRKKPIVIIDEEWISLDNVSFGQLGPMPFHACSGTLIDAIDDSTPFISSISINLNTLDRESLLDLTAEPIKWSRGEQIVAIGSEIMYVKKVEASGDTWNLIDVIRGRRRTPLQAHLTNAALYIIPWSEVSTFNHSGLLPDETVYIKSQPISTAGALALSSLTSKSITIYGKPYRPMPVENLKTSQHLGVHNVWASGNSITFSWDYYGPGTMRTGAGEQGFGEKIIAPSPPAGHFRLEFLEASVVVHTEDNLSSNELIMTWDNFNTAWGGSVPASFQVRVYQVSGNFESQYSEITVNQY